MSTGRKKKTPGEMEQAELVALIEDLTAEWSGPGERPPFGVAHLDTRSDVVTFVLRGQPEQLAYILAALRAMRSAAAGQGDDSRGGVHHGL